MYTYICEILVRFRSYLRVRALLAKSLKVRRHRKPSGTCRRGLSSIRALRLAWRALKLFFFREWIRRFPGFLCMRPILYVRTGKILSLFVALCQQAHSPEHTPQVDNRTCREYDVTTLPPISISRQNRACVTRLARYCCGHSSCVHRSLRSVIHVLSLSLLLLCVTDPRVLWTEM